MTKVKICGITNLEDALCAVGEGADALGFVFYRKSPRYVSPLIANQIVAKLPPFITPVALFVDAEEIEISDVISRSSRWLIQFHGSESPEECDAHGRAYIKAIRVKPDLDLGLEIGRYTNASSILLDAYKPGVPGGTGEVFNWDLIPEDSEKPIILAGGLTPENVNVAVTQVSPYAVDVSGGVEREKGLKDHKKIKDFIVGAKK